MRDESPGTGRRTICTTSRGSSRLFFELAWCEKGRCSSAGWFLGGMRQGWVRVNYLYSIGAIYFMKKKDYLFGSIPVDPIYVDIVCQVNITILQIT